SPGYVPGTMTTLSGDYSGNGEVDAADYVLWRHAIQTATTLPHDTTPESVSEDDYDLWRANYGQTVAIGSGLNGTSVPEPGGLLEVFFVVLMYVSGYPRGIAIPNLLLNMHRR
ncbi:MAG TPA: hypothetical protein VFW73_09175, partial [Lacipirellulaceae bacterium]|nr:hypothetical protein [Lacipirellulaceae bacterium]